MGLLRRGGPRVLPTAGRNGQRDSREEEVAGQGLPRLLAFRSLHKAGQAPVSAGGWRNGLTPEPPTQRGNLCGQQLEDIQAP